VVLRSKRSSGARALKGGGMPRCLRRASAPINDSLRGSPMLWPVQEVSWLRQLSGLPSSTKRRLPNLVDASGLQLSRGHLG
jgi:hypothetical protein